MPNPDNKFIKKGYTPKFFRLMQENGEQPLITNTNKLFNKAYGGSELGDIQSSIDLSQYEGISTPMPFKTDAENKAYLDKIYNDHLADNQWAVTQIFNATVGGLASGIAGGLENIAMIPQSFTDNFEKNGLAQFFADIKETINEYTPIYSNTQVQGLSDIDEMSDIWSSLKSIIDSAGSFALPGGAIGKTVSTTGKLFRLSQGMGKLGKFLEANKIANKVTMGTGSLLSKAANSKVFAEYAKAGLSGFFSNQLEGTVMAVELYDKVLNDLRVAGVDEEKAKRIAQNRANQMEEANRLLMLSNMYQLKGLTSMMSGTRSLLTKPGIGNAIKSAFTPKAGREILLQNLNEGVEEMFQSAIQQTLETKALSDANLIEDKSSIELFSDYLFSDQSLYEGVLGFFGGALQKAGAVATEEILGGSAGKEARLNRFNKQQEVMQKISEIMSKDMSKFVEADAIVKKAKEEGNESVEKLIADRQFIQLAAQNFEAGTTEHLENHLNDIIDNEATTDVEKQNAQNLKTKLLDLEQLYIRETAGREDGYHIFMAAATDNAYTEAIANTNKKIETTQESLISKTETLAKDKKIIVESMGVTKETTIDKFPNAITLNDKGELEFSEYIKKNNPRNQQTIDEIIYNFKTSTEYDNLERLRKHKDALHAARNSNNKIKDLFKSPEFQEERKQTQAFQNELSNIEQPNKKNIQDLKDKYKGKIADEQIAAMTEEVDKIIKQQEQQKDKEVEVSLNDVKAADKTTTVEDTKTTEEESTKEQTIEEKTAVDKTLDTVDTLTEPVNNDVEKLLGIDKTTEEESTEDKLKQQSQTNKDLNDKVVKESKQLETKYEETKEDNVSNKELQDYLVENNIVHEGNDKIAYLTSDYIKSIKNGKLVREDILDEDGKINVNYQAMNILDYSTYKVGTTIILRKVNDTSNEVVYDEYGNKIPFNDWVNANQDRDINSKYPIEIVDSKGTKLGYLHDIDWINSNNVTGKFKSIEQQRTELKQLRDKIMKDGSMTTTISSRTAGKLLRTTERKTIENLPNVTLTILKDGVYTNRADANNFPGKIYGKNKEGSINAMLKVNDNEYIAAPIKMDRLKDTYKQSIVNAIKAYITNDTNTIKTINDSIGVNINQLDGLKQYISLFTPVLILDNTEQNSIDLNNIQESVFNLINRNQFNDVNLTHGKFFIVIEKGNIIFGRKGFKPDTIQFVNKNSSNTRSQELKDMLDVTNPYMNATYLGLSIDKSIPIITDNGIVHENNSYEEFVKSNSTTNLYSLNINGKDIYTVQPVVKFNTTVEKTTTTSRKKRRRNIDINKFKKDNQASIDKNNNC